MLRVIILSAIASLVNAAPVDVFIAGQGAPQFRIPALVSTSKGTLVAFAEARTEPSTDCGYKWIVARRSVDFGVTWGPLIDVVGREWTGWATGNVQPVWHNSSGRIVLTVGSKDLHAGGRGCQPGTAVFAVDDGGTDGAMWGPARNISADLSSAKGGPTLVPGPGSGVVLIKTHPGRIVAVGVSGGAYSYDAVYWSDDAGLTWTASPNELGEGMDEANIAELSDGRLYLTLRNDQKSLQAYSLSSDGGETWGPILYDPTLITPACEASVATFNSALYFANTASTTARANLTVRRTAPGAAPTDWLSSTHLVAPGITWGGYSSMARDAVATNTGGILFERNITADTADGCVISYDNFPLDF